MSTGNPTIRNSLSYFQNSYCEALLMSISARKCSFNQCDVELVSVMNKIN